MRNREPRPFLLAMLICIALLAAGYGGASDSEKAPFKRETEIAKENTPKTPDISPTAGQAVSPNPVTVPQSGHQSTSVISAGDEQIDWHVISSGETNIAVSGSYKLSGTVGQTAIGLGSSTTYWLKHGFWQRFACCDKPGDANNDGVVNVGDAVFIVNYIFKGGEAPSCPGEADANCNHAITVGDAVYIVSYIFRGGPAPCCP